jgi:hypothetical protein
MTKAKKDQKYDSSGRAYLPSKQEAQSSNPNIAKERKK